MILAGIVAGGTGSRMGGELPKQFIELSGEPIIIRTVRQFLTHSSIDAVIIGINPQWEAYAEELKQKFLSDQPVYITPGGSDRSATLEKMMIYASDTLKCDKSTVILTHDAVRPFVTHRMIDDCIRSMNEFAVSTAVIPETDTVAYTCDGKPAAGFPDRGTLRRIQTPQTIRIGTFFEIFNSLNTQEKSSATDLCSLCLQRGLTVGLVRGEITNIKITYPEDIQFAKAVFNNQNDPG